MSHPSIQARPVPVHGAQLYTETAGDGPPVVLLHAGICDRRMWDPQVPALAPAHRVVRYDRRGFGLTPLVAGSFSQVGDLEGLLDRLEIERATLVGCSQGGRISIDFTLQFPHRVERLVLVASALSGFEFDGPEPPQFAEAEEAEATGDLDRLNELELQVWVDGPTRRPHQVDPAVRELVRDMNRIALSAPAGLGIEEEVPSAVDRLASIRVPTLVVVGEIDTPATLASCDHITRHIPGAHRVAMPGTAHLPNLERPADFNRHLLDFLSGSTR